MPQAYFKGTTRRQKSWRGDRGRIHWCSDGCVQFSPVDRRDTSAFVLFKLPTPLITNINIKH